MEPIAIVGIGCRFPGGANNPESFWKLLESGIDATTDIPKERWDIQTFYDPDKSKPGKANTYHGGFLERVDEFDAQFFGVSPREAAYLDPQQRILLEIVWEAFEDAGIDPQKMEGSNTGVYIGAFTMDYNLVQMKYVDFIDTHTAVGAMMTMVSNRISYIFDLRGPSLSVDTACSSSLVAIHLACQSIWNNQCSLAIAGGVNVITTPEYTIAESKGGFLSPEGRCKTFDAGADGYARGEGAGVVILKPLSQALADNDFVYAVIRGAGVNQDGHTNGITVPRGESQEKLMKEVYRNAGISPRQIRYVEAHGTGTPTGDPIEANAIANVVAAALPPGEKCLVGSVKTNLGHLEAASGIAGLIKSVLILQHKQIPAHLHLKNINPKIPADRLRIPTTLEPLPEKNGPALIGINSFGFGGTNAHIVIEAAPVPAENQMQQPVVNKTNPNQPWVLPLSARNKNALRDLAQKYIQFLGNETDGADRLAGICHSAAKRRAYHEHRLAVSAYTKEEFIQKLNAFLAGEQQMGISVGHTAANKYQKLVFVYTGMGPIWWAMGRQLLEREPVFKQVIERCDELIRHNADWSLLAELTADEANSRLDQPRFAQPANFALQIGLTELWRSRGMVPDAVVGHSVGEVSAVYTAGVLSLEDAIWLSVERGRAQQAAVNKGAMLAVGLSGDEARKLVSDLGSEGVSIAAINSPRSVTLAGDISGLEQVQAKLQEQDIIARFLKVNVAYHSVQMEPLQAELLKSLAKICPKPAEIPVFSTVSGGQMNGLEFTKEYWWQNVRQPVNFEAALKLIIQSGYDLFVEVGPHPALASAINECLTASNADGKILASLQRKKDELMTMAEALGGLWALGYPVNWERIYPGKYQYVKLPTYAWQRERYWAECEESIRHRLSKREHPLLGNRLSTPQPTWENEFNLNFYQFLSDHRLQDIAVFPGAGYVELGLACGQIIYGDTGYSLEDVKFSNAMFLSQGSPKVKTVFEPWSSTFEIYSRIHVEGNWISHASGRIGKAGNLTKLKKVNLGLIRERCLTRLSKDECYQEFRNKGFQYGPHFQGVENLWIGPDEVLGRISLPWLENGQDSGYILHPAILDACIQIMIVKLPPDFLPVGIDRFNIFGRPAANLYSYARVKEQTGETLSGDIQLLDESGNLIAEMIGIRTQAMAGSGSHQSDHIQDWLYELQWQPKTNPAVNGPAAAGVNQPPGVWIIFADKRGAGRKLAAQLEEQGERSIIVLPGESFQVAETGEQYLLNPLALEDLLRLFTEIAGKDRPAVRGVVHMWGLDAFDEKEITDAVLEEYNTLGCFSITTIAKAIEILGVTTKLWLITRGCQMIDENTPPAALLQTPVWGLGRVLGQQEMPVIWGGLIDLDPKRNPEETQVLFREIYRPDGEDQVVLRGGERLAARLIHKVNPGSKAPIRFRADGSYLITGGFGALGVLISKWMVENGARRLIIMSRAKFPPRAEWGRLAPDNRFAEQIAVIKEMEAKGATVHLAPVDVGDREQLTAYIQSYRDEGWPPVVGVIHSAGIVRDQLLQQMDFETYQLVLRPKVAGAWNLHNVFADLPLDFFILFSSTASLMGAMGQVNYASGNAFMDGLAHYRSVHGLAALSINWGPWAEVGMATKLNLLDFYRQKGIDAIHSHQGLEVMNRLFGQDSPQVAVIPATWSLTNKYYFANKAPAMVVELGLQESNQEAAAGGEESLGGTQAGPLQKVLSCPPEERQAVVESCLQEMVAGVLRFDRSKLDIHESLSTLGLDSMMATEIRNKIQVGFEISISIVDLLQGLSVAKLAVKVLTKLTEAGKLVDTPVSVAAIQELAQTAGDELVAELLEKIEGLSDEEIQKLIAGGEPQAKI